MSEPGAAADGPPIIAGEWRATRRLIPATYGDATPPYVAALAQDQGDVSALVELANATNQRLLAQGSRGVVDIGPAELVFDVDYSKVINAAFTYPGQGARLSSSRRGAWYAGLEIETCLAEIGYHHAVTLAETGVSSGTLDCTEFVCDIAGQPFADLRTGSFTHFLDPDSHIAGQGLAAELLQRGAAGVVYPSVRNLAGTCVACFRPALLPPVKSGETYRLVWDGDPHPTVTTVR